MSAVSSSPEFKVPGLVESICDAFEALSHLFPSPSLDEIENLTKATSMLWQSSYSFVPTKYAKTPDED